MTMYEQWIRLIGILAPNMEERFNQDRGDLIM